MLRMADQLPRDWEIDNACISISIALCCWPCNCYENNSKPEPDLIWNFDLYARLDLADVRAIIDPIHWYGPTRNLKVMFDRLVFKNGGNPKQALIERKNHELAVKPEHSATWNEMSVNYPEGSTAVFFCYGRVEVPNLPMA